MSVDRDTEKEREGGRGNERKMGKEKARERIRNIERERETVIELSMWRHLSASYIRILGFTQINNHICLLHTMLQRDLSVPVPVTIALLQANILTPSTY